VKLPAVQNLVIFLYKGEIGSISEGLLDALVKQGSIVFPEEKCCRYSSACSAGNPENKNPSSWLLN
jgi:hypothetical protein